MKYLVEFRIKPGSKNNVLENFELIGPNRNSGVSFRGAWIGTRADIIFVLAEGTDESLIKKACEAWADHGEFQIYPVIDIDQY